MSPKPVTVKGYAISGGGRAIYRVELSVDGGKTWEPVDKIEQEPDKISGMYWAWALWEKRVPKILTTSELVVRACKSSAHHFFFLSNSYCISAGVFDSSDFFNVLSLHNVFFPGASAL